MQPDVRSLEQLAALVRAEAEKLETCRKVEERIKGFRVAQGEGNERWFEELVFCLLTANYSARGAIACIAALNEDNIINEGSLNN